MAENIQFGEEDTPKFLPINIALFSIGLDPPQKFSSQATYMQYRLKLGSLWIHSSPLITTRYYK